MCLPTKQRQEGRQGRAARPAGQAANGGPGDGGGPAAPHGAAARLVYGRHAKARGGGRGGPAMARSGASNFAVPVSVQIAMQRSALEATGSRSLNSAAISLA